MKIRRLSLSIRIGVLLGTIGVGAVAGYLVGRESILRSVDSHLGDYADRLLYHEEEIAAEVSATIAGAGQSSDSMCSAGDIALLRRMNFTARFLKDVGRSENNTLICSATLGKLATSIPLQKPDVIGPNGTTIYETYPIKVPVETIVEVIGYHSTLAVISPDVFSHYPMNPIHYAIGFVDRDLATIVSNKFAPLSFPPELLKSKKAIRRGDTYFQARFSTTYPTGVVTYIQDSEIWAENSTLRNAYIGTGAAAGLICGLGVLLARRKRRSHTNQLRRAILSGNLSVVYQPIVELSTHRIVGAEALARWTDEDGDSVRPETIFDLAEADGFGSEITRFVVTRALDELLTLLESDQDFTLNINLAPADLADPRLLMLLDERLSGNRIEAARIAFELSERATSDREVAVGAIRRLRDRGHAIYIDDFGTGYSNLAYLSELNVDGIKINRSFIATIGTESVTASIVPQILAVAKALSLKVVVQGIERSQQVSYFGTGEPKILGQGWFLGLPVPARSLLYLCAEKTE